MGLLISNDKSSKRSRFLSAYVEGQDNTIQIDDNNIEVCLNPTLQNIACTLDKTDQGIVLTKNIRIRHFSMTKQKVGFAAYMEQTGANAPLIWKGTIKSWFPGQSEAAANSDSSSGELESPMTGKVLAIHCEVGKAYPAGQVLFVIEAMKMENKIYSPGHVEVKSIDVKTGDSIKLGDVLAELKPVVQ